MDFVFKYSKWFCLFVYVTPQKKIGKAGGVLQFSFS